MKEKHICLPRTLVVSGVLLPHLLEGNFWHHKELAFVKRYVYCVSEILQYSFISHNRAICLDFLYSWVALCKMMNELHIISLLLISKECFMQLEKQKRNISCHYLLFMLSTHHYYHGTFGLETWGHFGENKILLAIVLCCFLFLWELWANVYSTWIRYPWQTEATFWPKCSF